MSPDHRNVIIAVSSLFLVVFPTVLYSVSPNHRNTVHRGVRSLLQPRYLTTHSYLPQLIRKGSEWRFEDTNSTIGNCEQIPKSLGHYTLGEGYNKKVYEYGNVAIKKSLRDGQGMRECLRTYNDSNSCWNNQIRGFQNEIGLLLKLHGNVNIPTMYGYCLPVDTTQDMYIVTEKAQPLKLIVYADLVWERRLNIALHVVSFLISIQPLQPLDLRIDQFLLRSDDTPLLTDLDSLVVDDKYDELSLAKKFYGQFVNGALKSHDKSRNLLLSDLHHQFLEDSVTLRGIQRILLRLL
ncbi:unnamed protein product [Bursaphelenchus okinawaensis]|uniref:Protein kinase domain-containing protein n=1 Tax=Bursaphelenchus okinawaensis TaxID=465554 RepID=A0A811LB25_9BILA|nr:unnamed protein product [Bursaphelenchus okinawaensis]CAG9119830.1 unnamed protein product [Bursaphelenchus okinawaensis]